MPTLAHKRARTGKIPAAKVRRLKALATRIDADEQEEIKAMGRGIFQRHAMVRGLVEKLKAKRVENGMSLAALANRTGIAKSNLSRLENSVRVSPTLETLHRYAQALGMRVRVELN